MNDSADYVSCIPSKKRVDFNLDGVLEQMEEDENDNEGENGKKKTTKKRTNKKKTKKTKKVKQHEKDKQIEKEKRVQEFGIITEEMNDVELVNHYRENQLKTKEFIVDLYKSNNS